MAETIIITNTHEAIVGQAYIIVLLLVANDVENTSM